MLLKQQVEALQEAIRVEKGKKKKKKAIIAQFRENDGAGAIFFSPAKI